MSLNPSTDMSLDLHCALLLFPLHLSLSLSLFVCVFCFYLSLALFLPPSLPPSLPPYLPTYLPTYLPPFLSLRCCIQKAPFASAQSHRKRGPPRSRFPSKVDGLQLHINLKQKLRPFSHFLRVAQQSPSPAVPHDLKLEISKVRRLYVPNAEVGRFETLSEAHVFFRIRLDQI